MVVPEDGVVVPAETLFAVEGCGRCADLVAAHLLGAANAYALLAEHLREHESAPSMYGELQR